MVECQLPKLDVAGSSPVSRSNTKENTVLRVLHSNPRKGSRWIEHVAVVEGCERGHGF